MDLESSGEPMNASQAEPRTVARRRVVAAVALSMVTGLLTVACGSHPAAPTAAQASTPAATPPPQVCVSGPTQPSNRFDAVHGYITYADATDIWAADPNHPEKRISLGSS